MNAKQKKLLAALRIALGWVFFYSGITKILDPAWSAAGYLKRASNFPDFFHALARPDVLPVTNFLNEWGLTLIGACLILGIASRLTTLLGSLMMALYYLALPFPNLDGHSYAVDEHVIFILVLLVLNATEAREYWSARRWFHGLSIFNNNPRLKHWLG